MNKTKIEWCRNPDGSPGFTWNPISGCLNSCSYCYARRLANGRLKERYLHGGQEAPYIPKDIRVLPSDPFFPRFWEGKLKELYHPKLSKAKPHGIFVCDMSDLFGIGIPEEWTHQVMDAIRNNPIDRFYLLTKQPQNLIKFSPFPCWVGVTATEQYQFVRAVSELRFIEATIKYLSFEPLLAHIPMLPEALTLAGIKWLIIGAMTGSLEDIKKMLMEYPQLTLKTYDYKRWTLQPKIEWVEDIVRVADKAGIPVFLKDNLKPLLPDEIPFYDVIDEDPMLTSRLRQEMPK